MSLKENSFSKSGILPNCHCHMVSHKKFVVFQNPRNNSSQQLKALKSQQYNKTDLTCVLKSLKDLQLDGTADCWLLLVGRGKLIQELLVIFLQGRGKTGCCWVVNSTNLRRNCVEGGVDFIARC